MTRKYDFLVVLGQVGKELFVVGLSGHEFAVCLHERVFFAHFETIYGARVLCLEVDYKYKL